MATNWKALPDTSTPITPENLIKDQVAVGTTQPTGNQDVWLDTANDKIKYKNGSSYTELNVGGVSSYNSLDDKPQINSVELSGNKTLDSIGVPPKSHASSATTYGVGTTSNYGHCKLVNALTKTAYADGEALSAYQGKVLNDAIGGKAPTSHASSATTYGVGTTSNYGHCKLANNLTTSSYADGVALSANQGKALKDLIDTLTPVTLYNNTTGTQSKSYITISNITAYKKLQITFTVFYGENNTNTGGVSNMCWLDLTRNKGNLCRAGICVPYLTTDPANATDFNEYILKAVFEANLSNGRLYCALGLGTYLQTQASYVMTKVVGYKY